MKCESLPITVALQARARDAVFNLPKAGILGSNPICHIDVLPRLILYVVLWRWGLCDGPVPRPTNPLTPNAPLTSKRCILYIYSINIGTEYFKHGVYSPCFSLQNTVCFIILTYLVPVLFTFYIQGVLKFKKIIPAPKG